MADLHAKCCIGGCVVNKTEWEYAHEYVNNDEIRRKLKIYGEQGWELTSVCHDGSGTWPYHLFFKRPKT